MKKQSILTFYNFGTCQRYLQDANESVPIKEKDYILDNLDRYFVQLSDLGLVVTARVAHNKLDDLTIFMLNFPILNRMQN